MADWTTAVTDRSAADLEEYKTLRVLNFSAMTMEQKQAWLASKAAYNNFDMNRVEGFAEDLAKTIHDELGATVKVVTRNWAMEDIPTAAQLEQYLGNIQALKKAIETASPELPESMDKLDYNGANAIEQVCVDIHNAIDKILQNVYYCDEFYCGEINNDE